MVSAALRIVVRVRRRSGVRRTAVVVTTVVSIAETTAVSIAETTAVSIATAVSLVTTTVPMMDSSRYGHPVARCHALLYRR
jgi:hypothetical protein